jgi:CRISPR-associated protein Csx3
LAAACKAAYKAKFTPEFVQRVADSVAQCTIPLTLVDIGGIPSAENKVICAAATHAVILAGDMSRVPEWRAFCAELGIEVVAEIFSDYHGQEDSIQSVGEDGIFKGSVYHLERGEDISGRPCVAALAQFLVGLVADEEKK